MTETGLSFFGSFIKKRSATLLCKGLYILLFLKIIFSFQVAKISAAVYPIAFTTLWSKIFYFPLILSVNAFDFFYYFIGSIVLVSLLLPINFFSAFLNFWISALVMRLTIHFAAGPDLVLRSFLFISILLTPIPFLRISANIQSSIHDFGVIIGRIQICLIYFMSGFDKLLTREWRNGEAIYAVFQRDFMVIEPFKRDFGSFFNISTGWIVILFELLFPVLIWFRVSQAPVIFFGVIFHLVIAFILTIPDFGFLLIITYAFFFIGLDQTWFIFRGVR